MSGRPVDLNALRVFVAVVEAGGIRKAAEQLHLTKTSVSRQLADLGVWCFLKAGAPRSASSPITPSALPGRFLVLMAPPLTQPPSSVHKVAAVERENAIAFESCGGDAAAQRRA
jgi:Bacterial regulatory helix-turn-helix protein, lysR family